jgi:hypothetical protein
MAKDFAWYRSISIFIPSRKLRKEPDSTSRAFCAENAQNGIELEMDRYRTEPRKPLILEHLLIHYV